MVDNSDFPGDRNVLWEILYLILSFGYVEGTSGLSASVEDDEVSFPPWLLLVLRRGELLSAREKTLDSSF